MEKPTIISLGEVLWDLFPEGAVFGGAPANFACHAAILGADVSMVSAVGDDPQGEEARDILKRYGVDVSLMQINADLPTGTVGVTLDENGKPTFTIHEPSAWDQIEWTPELESRIAMSDAVYFGSLGQRNESARSTIYRGAELAREAGALRIVDINLRSPFFDDELIQNSIGFASILKLSDDELPTVLSALGISSHNVEEDLSRLREKKNLDLVVMTCGAEGATLVTAGGIIRQPGIPTTVQDTVGAGDSFTAAFLLGYLRKLPHEENLQNACEIAAKVCSHTGAVPDLTIDT